MTCLKQRESVPESLKNMLLVMSTSGVLVDPSLPPAVVDGALVDSELDLWELTWTKIVKFLPTLQDELFPKGTEGNSPIFFL